MDPAMGHCLNPEYRSSDVRLKESLPFEKFDFKPDVKQAMKRLNFVCPTELQASAIPLASAGIDLVVQAKSGLGKTLIYVVTILNKYCTEASEPQALVVVPTRELANQVGIGVKSFTRDFANFKSVCVIGGTSAGEDRKNLVGAKLVIGTPGRLSYLVESSILKTSQLKTFVLDEADKLLQHTSNFRSDIQIIQKALPVECQIIAVSATFENALDRTVGRFMKSPMIISTGMRATSLLGVRQFVYILPEKGTSIVESKCKLDAVRFIFGYLPFRQCVLFASSRSRAESYCNYLAKEGWPCDLITGGMSQNERKEAFHKFREFKTRILLATDLMARGIDSKDLNLVINLELPEDLTTYLHRIGRAGRFGSKGVAVTFLASARDHIQFTKFMTETGDTMTVYKFPTKINKSEGNLDLWDFQQLHPEYEAYTPGKSNPPRNPFKDRDPVEDSRAMRDGRGDRDERGYEAEAEYRGGQQQRGNRYYRENRPYREAPDNRDSYPVSGRRTWLLPRDNSYMRERNVYNDEDRRSDWDKDGGYKKPKYRDDFWNYRDRTQTKNIEKRERYYNFPSESNDWDKENTKRDERFEGPSPSTSTEHLPLSSNTIDDASSLIADSLETSQKDASKKQGGKLCSKEKEAADKEKDWDLKLDDTSKDIPKDVFDDYEAFTVSSNEASDTETVECKLTTETTDKLRNLLLVGTRNENKSPVPADPFKDYEDFEYSEEQNRADTSSKKITSATYTISSAALEEKKTSPKAEAKVQSEAEEELPDPFGEYDKFIKNNENIDSDEEKENVKQVAETKVMEEIPLTGRVVSTEKDVAKNAKNAVVRQVSSKTSNEKVFFMSEDSIVRSEKKHYNSLAESPVRERKIQLPPRSGVICLMMSSIVGVSIESHLVSSVENSSSESVMAKSTTTDRGTQVSSSSFSNDHNTASTLDSFISQTNVHNTNNDTNFNYNININSDLNLNDNVNYSFLKGASTKDLIRKFILKPEDNNLSNILTNEEDEESHSIQDNKHHDLEIFSINSNSLKDNDYGNDEVSFRYDNHEDDYKSENEDIVSDGNSAEESDEEEDENDYDYDYFKYCYGNDYNEEEDEDWYAEDDANNPEEDDSEDDFNYFDNDNIEEDIDEEIYFPGFESEEDKDIKNENSEENGDEEPLTDSIYNDHSSFSPQLNRNLKLQHQYMQRATFMKDFMNYYRQMIRKSIPQKDSKKN